MEDTPNMTYIQTLGRRKEAVAQVRLYPNGTGKLTVNGREGKDYFTIETMLQKVTLPFEKIGMINQFDVTVQVKGGGITGQADSVRLGIARALVEWNASLRTTLKKEGYLSRDARVRERKKYGKKSARRSPQWSKR